MKNYKALFVKDKHIICVLVYIFYVIFTFVLGLYHEPWADEAQSWLIARDCSFYDIIFKRCSYEGTPFLWFYILKIFIQIGWSYEYLFVISWFFSCIGIYLFLFKSKFPTIIKALFPFSYYIFYQYNVVSRSYSLIFPILCLIAIFYKHRFERKFLYCFLLAILASICAYSYVVSFMLILFLFNDYMLIGNRYKKMFLYIKQICTSKSNRYLCPKVKNFIIESIPLAILCVYMLFLFLICSRNPDCSYATYNRSVFSSTFYIYLIESFIEIFLDTNKFLSLLPFSLFVSVCFFYVSIKTFCKNKKQIFYFIILNLSLLCIVTHIINYIWHIGILFLVFIFCCWILQIENNITIKPKINKIFYAFWVFVLSVNVIFSVITSYYEILYNYDMAREIAIFLKQNKLENKNIIGVGCRLAAIQPYFEKNIFKNSKETYYSWSKKGIEDEEERFKELINNTSVAIVESSSFNFIKDYVNKFDNNFIIESCMFAKINKLPYASKYVVLMREIS